MCGRFSFGTSKEKVLTEYPKLQIDIDFKPNYNVAPTQNAYLITNERPKELRSFRWGLIPYWSKNDHASSNMINARSEGIFTKASFRIPIRKRRCLVFADGFYEWRKPSKVPYRILLKDESIMALAGIWDIWQSPLSTDPIYSFSIITTPPNMEMETIHDRMPVILTTKEEKAKWLTATDLSSIKSLMRPLEEGLLKTYTVSPRVNSIKSNSPDLHDPYGVPPTLF